MVRLAIAKEAHLIPIMAICDCPCSFDLPCITEFIDDDNARRMILHSIQHHLEEILDLSKVMTVFSCSRIYQEFTTSKWVVNG